MSNKHNNQQHWDSVEMHDLKNIAMDDMQEHNYDRSYHMHNETNFADDGTGFILVIVLAIGAAVIAFINAIVQFLTIAIPVSLIILSLIFIYRKLFKLQHKKVGRKYFALSYFVWSSFPLIGLVYYLVWERFSFNDIFMENIVVASVAFIIFLPMFLLGILTSTGKIHKKYFTED